MKPVERHLADCLDLVDQLPPMDVSLVDALDCVLTVDAHSRVSLPPFDNSSMDGYAVVVADVADAGEDAPVELPVVGDLPAGTLDDHPLVAGSAVRIMTGAPVPSGTGAVVPVEWTDGGIARVLIRRAPAAAQNIRRAGEDVVTGDLLVAAGTRLTPRHLGLLAATGHARVRVHPRPRVVVMSTGSEIVPPGRPLTGGQIYDSNSYALAAAVTEAGGIAVRVGSVQDDAGALLSALEDQLVRADVVITTGGVSAGAYDTVKEVLSRLGTVSFDKVAMQPGMPQGMGTVTGRLLDDDATGPGRPGVPIFTLPGNPVSAYVSFEVFVRPALRKMLGEDDVQRPTVQARAESGWSSPPGKRQYVRVHLTGGEVGSGSGPAVRPVGGQGSHLVANLAQANALAVVGEEVTRVEAGDQLTCMVLDRGRR